MTEAGHGHYNGLRSLISIVRSILVSTAGGVKLSVIYLTFYLLPAQMRGFEIIEKVYYWAWAEAA